MKLLAIATMAASVVNLWAADVTPRVSGGDWRPGYHYTAPNNWMNDPNGMVIYKGEYHLFYQVNPDGVENAHKGWGHAVSGDLIHWRDLPVALKEENGVEIYSGSAVVDEHNSSGLCEEKAGDKSCLIAIYAGHGHGVETQNIAYSNDRGRTWTKYKSNPVVDLHLKDFRDPKVIWYEPKQEWVMVTALSDQHKLRLFQSKDLIHWSALSDFGPAGATGGVWECPDLFELPVEGGRAKKWVMIVNLNPGGVAGGSGTQYFVGDFDGERFKDETSGAPLWLDYGKDYYAGVSFFGHMPGDERRVMIAWCSNWLYAGKTPETGWRGMMALPRELTLHETAEGLRLGQVPVRELKALRTAIAGDAGSKVMKAGKQAEVELQYGAGAKGNFGVRVLAGPTNYTEVGVDTAKGVVYVDRTHSGTVDFSTAFPGRQEAPLPKGEAPKLNIFVDRSSVEVFVNGGKVTIADRVFPSPQDEGMELFSEGAAKVKPESVRLWKMASAWKQ